MDIKWDNGTDKGSIYIEILTLKINYTLNLNIFGQFIKTPFKKSI